MAAFFFLILLPLAPALLVALLAWVLPHALNLRDHLRGKSRMKGFWG